MDNTIRISAIDSRSKRSKLNNVIQSLDCYVSCTKPETTCQDYGILSYSGPIYKGQVICGNKPSVKAGTPVIVSNAYLGNIDRDGNLTIKNTMTTSNAWNEVCGYCDGTLLTGSIGCCNIFYTDVEHCDHYGTECFSCTVSPTETCYDDDGNVYYMTKTTCTWTKSHENCAFVYNGYGLNPYFESVLGYTNLLGINWVDKPGIYFWAKCLPSGHARCGTDYSSNSYAKYTNYLGFDFDTYTEGGTTYHCSYSKYTYDENGNAYYEYYITGKVCYYFICYCCACQCYYPEYHNYCAQTCAKVGPITFTVSDDGSSVSANNTLSCVSAKLSETYEAGRMRITVTNRPTYTDLKRNITQCFSNKGYVLYDYDSNTLTCGIKDTGLCYVDCYNDMYTCSFLAPTDFSFGAKLSNTCYDELNIVNSCYQLKKVKINERYY